MIDLSVVDNYLTGGIPFAVTLPKAPNSINMDLMTTEELHTKLQQGYDDIEAGKVLRIMQWGNITGLPMRY